MHGRLQRPGYALFPERTLDSEQGVSYSLLGTTHLEELLLGNLVENA